MGQSFVVNVYADECAEYESDAIFAVYWHYDAYTKDALNDLADLAKLVESLNRKRNGYLIDVIKHYESRGGGAAWSDFNMMHRLFPENEFVCGDRSNGLVAISHGAIKEANDFSDCEAAIYLKEKEWQFDCLDVSEEIDDKGIIAQLPELKRDIDYGDDICYGESFEALYRINEIVQSSDSEMFCGENGKIIKIYNS